jgi:uncharacterized protein YcbX
MTIGHPLGTIAQLYRYPVKSLAPQALERTEIGERGLPGDRCSALFVATHDHVRTGKPYRGKEHPLLHTTGDRAAAARLASDRGVAIDLRDDGPFFDDSPISLVFDRWIAALERVVGEPVDPLRFRANVYVRARADFAYTERELAGATLAIGNVRLRCLKPTKRCVTPSYDVETGERSDRVARAIAIDLDNVLGIYCAVERPGRVALADAVLLDAPAA